MSQEQGSPLSIYLIDSFEDEPLSVAALAEKIKNTAVPADVSEVVVHRKFIVMASRPGTGNPDAPEKIILAIGPVFKETKGKSGYRHASIYGTLLTELKEEISEGGRQHFDYDRSGGMLTVRLGGYVDEAEFSGASADYGVFSPLLLRFRQEIATALDIRMHFEFRDYVEPKK
jgi:hypothetical protein